jgi:hypothetical protein
MPNLPNLPNLGFNKANGNSDRKSGPSSDTYNAHHSPAETRPRQGSNPRRPYADRPTPSPFADIGRSRNATPNESPDSTPVLSSGDYDSNSNGTSSRDEPDLLGTWDSNDRGITANFARMNMNGRDRSGSRSRRQSTLPFEDIAEDPYRTRESTSTTYSKDWSRTDSRDSRDSYSRPRPFSVHGAPKGGFPTTPHDDTDPFRERDRDDYGYRGYDDDVRGMRDGSPQFDDFLVDRRGGRGANVDAEGYARAVALFDFNARESDDLGFKKGQVLTVLDGANDSVQWWRGRLGDDTAEGIFPANYVEVLDIPRKLRGGLTKTQLRTRLLSGQDFE